MADFIPHIDSIGDLAPPFGVGLDEPENSSGQRFPLLDASLFANSGLLARMAKDLYPAWVD